MKKFDIPIFCILLFSLFFGALASARVGVGVNTGKIEIDKPIKPGETINIPSVVVINTGDEPSEYQFSIEYQVDTPEIKPAKEWFSFEPKTFYLEPGEKQIVNTILTLPVKKVEPGDYFAFLSASPIVKFKDGATSIGVAAASRLYFTIDHANIFQALYYRFADFYADYHPWNTIVLVLIFLATLIMIIKKKFNIKIARK